MGKAVEKGKKKKKKKKAVNEVAKIKVNDAEVVPPTESPTGYQKCLGMDIQYKRTSGAGIKRRT